jgi:SepF-like predicted cell division protein (DUF552 family)
MGLLHDLVDDLKKIKPKKEPEVQELPVESTFNPINLRIEVIKSLQDVERVAGFVKNGDIVFVRSKTADQELFKNAAKMLKEASAEVNGDIIGFSDNSLLVTPNTVKIVR